MDIRELYRALRYNAPHRTARAALDMARSYYAAVPRKTEYRKDPGTWNPPVTEGYNKGGRWLENYAGAGVRHLGLAHDIENLDHTGWFSDDDGLGETYTGSVFLLPASRDHRPRLVPGYLDPFNKESAFLWLRDMEEGEPRENVQGHWRSTTVSDIARDCARTADRCVEILCEHEREYHRAWQAGAEYARLCDQARRHIDDVAALARAARENPTTHPTIRALLVAHVKSHHRDWRCTRTQRAALLRARVSTVTAHTPGTRAAAASAPPSSTAPMAVMPPKRCCKERSVMSKPQITTREAFLLGWRERDKYVGDGSRIEPWMAEQDATRLLDGEPPETDNTIEGKGGYE